MWVIQHVSVPELCEKQPLQHKHVQVAFQRLAQVETFSNEAHYEELGSRRDRLETRRRRIWLRGASPLVLLYLCRRMTGMFHCTYQNMHVTSPGFSFTRGVRGLVLPYQPAAVCRTRCETEVKVGADIWSTAQKHRRSAAQWSGGTDVFRTRWSGSEQTNRSVNDDEKPQSQNTRRI